MMRKPQPDFPVWQRDTLDRFAAEAYHRLRELEAANEQLQKDFKDAMAMLRQELKK